MNKSMKCSYRPIAKYFIFAGVLIVAMFNIKDVDSQSPADCHSYIGNPEGCTTILMGKQATADGSVMMGHNEDMGTLSGRLAFQPRLFHINEVIDLNYVSIPQVRETYRYWASGNSQAVADKHYDGGWILCGMNEFGVSIGCNTMSTREEPIPSGEGILRYSIRQLILERCSSASEAVRLVGKLIDAFGQSESVVAYCIADRDEAWLVETTYRHWVARRIPDDGFHVIANQYTITTEWDLASEDLVDYAVKKGWYDPESGPFNFKKAYTDPDRLDRPVNTSRELLGKQRLREKVGDITVKDVLSVLSEPPIQTTGTQGFMVWHLRKYVPRQVGCVMWHGMSGANTSLAVPIYVGGNRVPEEYTDAPYAEDQHSAWWRFERLQKLLYPERGKYSQDYNKMKKKLEKHQNTVFEESVKTEIETIKLWEGGHAQEIESLLSDFTYKKLVEALETAVHIASLIE
jgi:dipeptidase